MGTIIPIRRISDLSCFSNTIKEPKLQYDNTFITFCKTFIKFYTLYTDYLTIKLLTSYSVITEDTLLLIITTSVFKSTS